MSARSDLAAHLRTELAAEWPELTVYDHGPDTFAVPCLILHRTGARIRSIDASTLEWDLELFIVTQRAVPDQVADTQDDLFQDTLLAIIGYDKQVTVRELGAVEALETETTVYAQSVLPIKVKE